MAPLPPAPGVAKLTFKQTFSGRSFGDSLFFFHSDSSIWTVPELQNLTNAGSVAFQADVAPLQNANLSLDEVDAIDLSDNLGRGATTLPGTHGTSVGAQPLPLNTVMHVALEVLRRYRGGRPGFNISGLDRTNLNDERSWTVPFCNTVAIGVAALATNIASSAGLGAPTSNVGVSYRLAKVIRPVPLIEAIVAYECQQRICSLRKRLGKGITG